MNDPDFIESIAAFNDQKEIYYRSIGMFELAQWYQWAADSTRLRQPTLCTRGSGDSSMVIYESDGWLMGHGDMTPEQAHHAGEYLVREACQRIAPDVSDAARYINALQVSAQTLQNMLAHLKPHP